VIDVACGTKGVTENTFTPPLRLAAYTRRPWFRTAAAVKVDKGYYVQEYGHK
jgi:hypothetical protein